MCGICGLVSLDGAAVDPDVLAAMNDTLVHRGPDSSGAFVEGNVGLAARRLAIIDLAGGDQPVGNEDGRIQVVQNGEIYNHAELRTRLERAGHRFATRSDTEVLVHLYEERGPAFVEELRGMFAIALWDRLERRLLLARDRFGIKPLYYRVAGGELSFASELKALLAMPGFSHEVDPDALEAYLAFNSIPAPLTIFAEARKLPPGHMLLWQGGAPALRRYARPRPVPAGRERAENEGDLAEELRERLRDSVRAHLVSDVPVGVLLSGGIDSSALAALAARESSYRVSTFSIGFEERAFNELDQARLVAERYGTDHHELIVRPDAVELLPRLAQAFDEPFADSSALPTYLVSELAAGTVKVALSGEGGDELFGGYHTYVADNLAPRVRPRGVGAPPAGGCAAELVRPGELRLQGQALRPLGTPAAARAPPRLEGDLLSRRACAAARRPPRRRRSARRLPRPLRGDRGRGRARAAPGRRHRDLPGGRPAREDGPCQHGALARDPRSVLRPGGRRAGPRASAPDEGARALEEAAPAPGGLDAAARAHRARAETGVLDPGRRVAAGRPGAVCPRHALAGPPPRAGFLRPGGRHAR